MCAKEWCSSSQGGLLGSARLLGWDTGGYRDGLMGVLYWRCFPSIGRLLGNDLLPGMDYWRMIYQGCFSSRCELLEGCSTGGLFFRGCAMGGAVLPGMSYRGMLFFQESAIGGALLGFFPSRGALLGECPFTKGGLLGCALVGVDSFQGWATWRGGLPGGALLPGVPSYKERAPHSNEWVL